jgi:hypothetical protein
MALALSAWLGCASSPPPARPAAGAGSAGTRTAVAEVDSPSPQPTATDFAPFVGHFEEADAPKELGPDNAKLLAIAAASPKTQKALLKHHLWKALSECSATPVTEVKPAPGLLVASGKTIKVRDKVYENLKMAAALAKQRGLALEIVEGWVSIGDAVKEWNHAIIEMADKLVKAAPPADRKEKSFAADARKALGEEGPRAWDHSTCDSGRLGGWFVFVQLVTVDASGKRGAVLVKAGDEGVHFSQDTFEGAYWNKPNGKNFRTLSEIMSAGKFVRQCSQAYAYFTSATLDGTWRCKEGTESWDPENRPLPAWQ